MVTGISFVSLLCSGGGTHVDATEEGSDVELNLTCSDVVFPAALVLEVRNVGPKVLFLDRRLAVTNRSYPGEVMLNIQRKNGDHINFNCRVNMGPPQDDDYQLLRPGEVFSSELNFRCFRLDPPDEYTITAGYEDRNQRPPPPQGAKLVKGPFVSNTVKLALDSKGRRLACH